MKFLWFHMGGALRFPPSSKYVLPYIEGPIARVPMASYGGALRFPPPPPLKKFSKGVILPQQLQ